MVQNTLVRMIVSLLSTLFSGLFLALLMLPLCASAHNKVVVVPLGGDDNTPEPFMPVAPNQPLNSNYTIGSLTVIDQTTGLEWQKTDDNTTRTWDEAITYCASGVGSSGTLDGKYDWRLPSILELQSIVDYNDFSAAINGAAFPGTNASSYWSASSYASGSALAWRVYFNNGNVFADSKTVSDYVRCVR